MNCLTKILFLFLVLLQVFSSGFLVARCNRGTEHTPRYTRGLAPQLRSVGRCLHSKSSNQCLPIGSNGIDDKCTLNVTAAGEGRAADVAHTSTSVLLDLGYSKAEYDILKPSVVSQIITLSVRRPNNGLPRSWVRKEVSDNLENYEKSHPSDERARISKPRSIRKARDVDKRKRTAESTVDFVQASGSSTTFLWNPKSAAIQDANFTDILEDKTTAKQDLLDLHSMDELVEFDNADDLKFLPTLQEFKSMLLQESRFRMNIVGDWIAPLLRLENKWRYKLYEGFLHFLDVGLGEVVDKAVTALDSDDGEGYDDEDEDGDLED